MSKGPIALTSIPPHSDPGRLATRLLVWMSIVVLTIDTCYSYYFGITYNTRQNCIIYSNLPRWAFMILEYVVELFLVVIVGVFIASVIEQHFDKIGRWVPKNPVTAFAVASVVPVCSCSAIPLISAGDGRVPFRTVITFVVAAPLLNPYILILSFSVLGTEYAVLRVAASMILAISTGYIAEFFRNRFPSQMAALPMMCDSKSRCHPRRGNVYEASYAAFKKLLPWLCVAGALGIVVEVVGPTQMVFGHGAIDNTLGTILVILVGLPVYFCNGADVLFLRPLLVTDYLPLGAGIAFSLTSTSICITSFVMLIKYLGRRLTMVILASIVVITTILSMAIESMRL